jgi:membrane protease YdiL (CAAX protease family)
VRRKLVWWLVLVGSMTALAYGSRVSEGKPPRDALYQYSVAASGFVLYVIVLGLVLWIARGLTRVQLGLRRPVSWKRALGLALALILLVLIAEAVLEPLLHATREQGLEPPRWEPARATPFALNAAVVVLVAPFVEELIFRGLGFAVLLRFGAPVAIVVTAASFAAAHGLIDGFPALFIFGLAIAVLRWRTRSVFPGMLFHACFNSVALVTSFIR